MAISPNAIYRIVLREYPDILEVKQVSDVLGVSTKTVYRTLRAGALPSIKVGREYRVPKIALMQYMKLLDSDSDLSLS